MLKIGVTGGIGSGKSTVCRMFARHGIPVLSADQIARELIDTNPVVRKQVVRLLGPLAYRGKGKLDRSYVAARVFASRRIQRAINRITHPRVLKEIAAAFRALERKGHDIAVVEAALIFEAGMDESLDAVIVVDADRRTRIRRIQQRDGASAAEVRRRMAAQWSSRQKTDRADIVVTNNGTKRDLQKKMQFLLKTLRLIARSGTHG